MESSSSAHLAAVKLLEEWMRGTGVVTCAFEEYS